MKKWKNIKIEEQLMKDIEKVKNEKHFKSKSKFLEDAVNEKLKRIRDEDMEYNFAAIQEFLQKNAVTLRRKGVNNMLELTSQTLSNSEDIKKLEKKLTEYNKIQEYIRRDTKIRNEWAEKYPDRNNILVEIINKHSKELQKELDKQTAKWKRS